MITKKFLFSCIDDLDDEIKYLQKKVRQLECEHPVRSLRVVRCCYPEAVATGGIVKCDECEKILKEYVTEREELDIIEAIAAEIKEQISEEK